MKRKELIRKICYRAYICDDVMTMVIINIANGTTTLLEEDSALCFLVLVEKNREEILEFIKIKNIEEKEICTFLDELEENGVIGKSYCQNENVQTFTLEEEKKELVAFESKLYKNGYLYNVHIDITDKCNLRCVHCYHTFDKYHDENMTLEEIKKFVDSIYSLGCFVVTLSGGEILTRADIWEIVEYISKKGMVISLFTNGTLLKESDIEKIKEYNIYKIGISLYSVNNQIHDQITGEQGSAEKTKATLEKLRELNCAIEVKCVLMKSNFSQYASLNDYCKERGFSLTLDTTMTPRLDGNQKPLEYSLDYQQIQYFALDENYNYYVGKNEVLDWNKSPCSAGKTSLYCSPTGKIYPCVSLRIDLGNADNIVDVWKKSEKLKKWQKITLADFSQCGKHTYCQYCTEVCAGICLMENKDYLASDTSQCVKAQAREEAYKRLQK